MDGGDVGTLIVSSVALVVSAFSTFLSIRATRAAPALDAIVDVFARRNEKTFNETLKAIIEGSWRSTAPVIEGVSGIPDKDFRANVWTVLVFYEDLGRLAAHKVVDEDLIIGSFGPRALAAWRVLWPYIREERRLDRESSINIYYQYLIKRMESNTPDRIHDALLNGRSRRWFWRR